jgi:hypothetical protein
VARTRPEAGCRDLAFLEGYAVDEAGELALEDYAREVGGAGAAEVIRMAAERKDVTGVHLCALGAPLTEAALADIEGFARALAAGRVGGLGWS